MKNLKNELSKLKYKLSAFLLCLLFSSGLIAQQAPMQQQPQQQVSADYDEEELQKFASAAEKMIVIQQESQKRMVEIVEEEDLNINKFNEIMTAQQNQQTENLDASPEDLQKFDKAAMKIMEMQTEVQNDMVQTIEEQGLAPEKYEEILMAYQSNPQVKAKVDAIIQE